MVRSPPDCAHSVPLSAGCSWISCPSLNGRSTMPPPGWHRRCPRLPAPFTSGGRSRPRLSATLAPAPRRARQTRSGPRRGQRDEWGRGGWARARKRTG
eukprot:657303-Prorocentrum_minimum.AAC.1